MGNTFLVRMRHRTGTRGIPDAGLEAGRILKKDQKETARTSPLISINSRRARKGNTATLHVSSMPLRVQLAVGLLGGGPSSR